MQHDKVEAMHDKVSVGSFEARLARVLHWHSLTGCARERNNAGVRDSDGIHRTQPDHRHGADLIPPRARAREALFFCSLSCGAATAPPQGRDAASYVCRHTKSSKYATGHLASYTATL